MREVDFKILKFLLEGKAYSDNAVMMNFGIDEEELGKVYQNLQKERFIETYAEYEKHRGEEKSESKGCGCGKGSCSSSDSKEGHSCCSQNDWDQKKIWVLTEKANEMIF